MELLENSEFWETSEFALNKLKKRNLVKNIKIYCLFTKGVHTFLNVVLENQLRQWWFNRKLFDFYEIKRIFLTILSGIFSYLFINLDGFSSRWD